MIDLDGSMGEGGGQIVRTALALSLVTGKAFSISRIRAGRKKSGLMRQHLTALNAAGEIGGAEMSGNGIGATAFSFRPGKVTPGSYRFSIGSAGSCVLVLQTILPALMTADKPSRIVLEGGTHNPFAPPFDFLEKSFLPLIGRMGPKVTVGLERAGFYPAGGGRFHVDIDPAGELEPIDLTSRGNPAGQTATALVSRLPLSIARRELKVVREKLGWDREDLVALEIDNAAGPGNVLSMTVTHGNIVEVFTGFGERGVRAEKVASRAVRSVREYLESKAAAGKYLADQLLIPMAMAGTGKMTTILPTRHTITNIEVIKRFLDVQITVAGRGENLFEIEVRS